MSQENPTSGPGEERSLEPPPEPHPLDPMRHVPLEIEGDGPALLVCTRKGTWALCSDAGRRHWSLSGPAFLGHINHHAVLDPRDRTTLLLAARTGHLGPTVFRSSDLGRSWTEATAPPAFPKASDPERGRAVEFISWLSPGHESEPGVWYAGTSPQGLFRSEDGGGSWASVAGFNEHPMWWVWTGEGKDETPDGPMTHSILVDPRDPRHLYLGLSGGGFFESVDGGEDWKPLNAGCFVDFGPEPYPEYGQDPHCVRLHPLAPDVLYQQNHCGIYRMDRMDGRWVRIGENMPKEVGDVGFPMVLHPRDPRTVWVFPMDGTGVWPRTSPSGRPAVYATRDAGKTWQRQDAGLPASQAWLTVKRQAMCADARDPVGIYFGTTNGEVWASTDEGASWTCIARHLPHIYSVEAVDLAG